MVVEGVDEVIVKDVVMYVVVVNLEFFDCSEVFDECLEYECGIFKEEILNEGKLVNIVDKIVEGCFNKFFF